MTAPVAMGIAEKVGGLPSLTAVLVVSTGILGAVLRTGLSALVTALFLPPLLGLSGLAP